MSWRVGVGANTQPLVGGSLRAAVPDLRTVDHPLVAVANGAGAQAGQVGAGVGFGVAEREDDLAPGDSRQELLLVLLGAVPHDHRRHRRDGEVGAGDTDILELAHEQMLVHGRETKAAILFRPVQPEPAFLTDLAAERRELTALILQPVLGHLCPQRGRDVLGEELPHFSHPRALLVVELEVHEGDTIEKVVYRYPASRMQASTGSMSSWMPTPPGLSPIPNE